MIRVNYVLLAKIVVFALLVLMTAKAYLYFSFYLVNHLHPSYLSPNLTQASSESTALSPRVDNRDLIWFAHISDLHVSKFYDPRRTEDFRSMCNFLASHVRPSAVVVTGDITDAKDRNLYGSAQYKEEWSTYNQIVQACGILNMAKWLDVRGNHDTFDVISDVHVRNLFQKYAAQGRYHLRSYMEDIIRQGVSIRFVAVDFTPTPGLKRPFNFFGTLSDDEVSRVREMLSDGDATRYRVVFGHYPTSAITYMYPPVREMLRDQLYLCGHFHTPLTYMRHKTGLMELELADWKERRTYRIAAFDQGFFAFTDLTYDPFGTNVAVVVTNPKNPTFFREEEPIHDIVRTSSVRALVFSDTPITEVSVQLPGKEVVRMEPISSAESFASPLYSASWNPENYGQGQHKICIMVTLRDGNTVHHEDTFSLDGTQPAFNLRSRLLLMMDWQPFSEYVFAIIACLIILTLSMLRISHRHSAQLKEQMFPAEVENSFIMGTLRKFWILSSMDRFFFPLIAFVMYACFLPWTCGYVLNDRIGVIFAWGTILIDDLTFVPPDMIHIYGVGALLMQTFYIYVLACAVEKSYLRSARDKEIVVLLTRKNLTFKEILASCVGLFHDHSSFIAIVLFQFHTTWALCGSYGFVSIISPCGIGRIILTMYLYSKGISIEDADLAEIRLMWPLDNKECKN